ncbi:class I SAM-dependent methyltransferase [Aliigemmobacter aestuarii]|uniref:Class I SAM-dependent methyltransferase n=1 Tax=Aliigemmobacter aestuarii TaxID=1445661 RepID=A0A4S3MVR8_9RHOB|nr:class I SAM-dependent methyltransferase [Gemmobacter aestuarii]THD85681.1 class I SAM-dependent methyltransferase [Gemmobacter aestuarii]
MEEESKRDRVRGKLLESLPKGGIVAEVGVWEGNFSKRILEICQPKELHLIDPWLYQPEFANTGFGRKKNENRMEEIYQGVVAAFRDDKRVIIHRATSDEALAALKDGYLDWVYLDGNHNEPFIDNDIALSLKKVKHDGIICGDDFNWQATTSGAPVKHAVEKAVAGLGDQASLSLMANQWTIRLNRPAPKARGGKK